MIEKRSNSLEIEIIEKIVSGNRTVIDTLYLENYPIIRHFIEKNNGNEENAKDIYQDAFIVLIRNIKKGIFKGDSSISTYLYAIARRMWLKELNTITRRQSKIKDIQNLYKEENDYDHEHWEQHEIKLKQLNKVMYKLGEPCSTILTDFYVNNLSMEDIKTKMGYTTAGNAKNQKYKCMQRLRKIFFK